MVDMAHFSGLVAGKGIQIQLNMLMLLLQQLIKF